MLTHANIIADCVTMKSFKHVKLSTDDVLISYLPLAHMFERNVQAVVYSKGARVGFSR